MIFCGDYTNETACNAAPKDECVWEDYECMPFICKQCCLDHPCPASAPHCVCEDGSADMCACLHTEAVKTSPANATTPDNGERKKSKPTNT